MSKQPKQVRWVCPEGLHPGVLGPQKPRMDNICRYCLDCSKKAGKLVQRTAPALDRQREQAAVKSQARRAIKQGREKAKEDARYLVGDGIDLRRVMKLAWGMESLGKINGKVRSMPEISIRRTKVETLSDGRQLSVEKYSGYAYPWRRRITMTIKGGSQADPASAIGLLIHEMAHMACYWRNEPFSDSDRTFGRRVDAAIEEWNKRYGKTYVEVDSRKWGAYRGAIGRANRRALKVQAARRRAGENPLA